MMRIAYESEVPVRASMFLLFCVMFGWVPTLIGGAIPWVVLLTFSQGVTSFALRRYQPEKGLESRSKPIPICEGYALYKAMQILRERQDG